MSDRAAGADAYMRQRMLFVPRMFRRINTWRPECGQRFADFYEVGKRDGALTRATKELIFLAIAVAYASPACLVHVIPAIEAGVSDEEIGEALMVGVIAAGFVPGGRGFALAAEYAAKAREVARLYRAGQPWEYVAEPRFGW
ncbi:MAG: carboxymuconolactone decarboxylase family protein [Chloroflexi bacterium]|nr:carboxymuconolactone decarboxylase family protein [Chloroflexota bacterium]